MNKVILALIIPLSLWPFHHKKPEKPYVQKCYTDGWMLKDGTGAVEIPCSDEPNHKAYGINDGGWVIIQPAGDGSCESTGGPWFYIKDDDGVIGIGASCEAAKKDWNSAHIDPVRMSRS